MLIRDWQQHLTPRREAPLTARRLVRKNSAGWVMQVWKGGESENEKMIAIMVGGGRMLDGGQGHTAGWGLTWMCGWDGCANEDATGRCQCGGGQYLEDEDMQ